MARVTAMEEAHNAFLRQHADELALQAQAQAEHVRQLERERDEVRRQLEALHDAQAAASASASAAAAASSSCLRACTTCSMNRLTATGTLDEFVAWMEHVCVQRSQ